MTSSDQPSQVGRVRPAVGLSLASFALGIVGVAVSFGNPGGFVLGSAAVALGIVAMVKKQSRFSAIIGIVLGGAAMTLAVVSIIAIAIALSSLGTR